MNSQVHELLQRQGCAIVDSGDWRGFTRHNKCCAILLASDREFDAEEMEMAVLLGELLCSYKDRLNGALMVPKAAAELRKTLHTKKSASLLLFRNNRLVAQMSSRLRWRDYDRQVRTLIATPRRSPNSRN